MELQTFLEEKKKLRRFKNERKNYYYLIHNIKETNHDIAHGMELRALKRNSHGGK